MAETHTYRIMLMEKPEGGYTVTVSMLPGCVTDENCKHALEMAQEAIAGYREVPGEDLHPIQTSNFNLTHSFSLKIQWFTSNKHKNCGLGKPSFF